MKLEIIDTPSFNSMVENSDKAVITFSADWCGPCRMLTPTLEKLAIENPDVRFAKIIIDDNRSLASQMGVMSIPTTFFYSNGSMHTNLKGNTTPNSIQKIINEL